MKTKLSQSMLSRISHQLEQNPLWAMLLANEYLEGTSPMHKALKSKARQNLSYILYPETVKPFLEDILNGKKLAELGGVSSILFSRPGKLKRRSIPEKLKMHRTSTISFTSSVIASNKNAY